jgi:hypothetical protein
LRVGQDDLQQTSIQAYLRLGENCQRLFDQLEKDYPSPKRKVKSK